MKRVRAAAVSAVFLLAFAAAPAQQSAAGYPSGPVRLIVPFAPGGGTDIIARLTAQELGRLWGRSVLVDNRGGSGGVVGTQLAARAAAGGCKTIRLLEP